MAIAVTVDIVVFSFHDSALRVLLGGGRNAPQRGRFALPGRFVGAKENLEQAALRELKEEAGVKNVYLEQLYSFGDPAHFLTAFAPMSGIVI